VTTRDNVPDATKTATAAHALTRIDPRVPHPARVYAYWLGSKDHYPADREAAEEVAAHRPQVVTGGICEHVDADLRDPEKILAEAGRTLDLTRPAAVILTAVLHFLTDADDPAGVVAAHAAALAPGSFVAISHLTSDFAPDAVTAGVAVYNALVPAGITARSHAQVTALFGGLRLVAPGIVPVSEWRPGHAPVHSVSADLYAGLASTRRPADHTITS